MIDRGDERAVTVQIGAILLLAILFTALALYQVNVVPAENEVVEINHNEDVQGDLQQTRNTIVSVRGGGGGGSQSVTLGTAYPTRSFAVNPGSMAGTVETEPLGEISIDNASEVDGEGRIVSDWESGYTTYGLSYTPGYNEYQRAPRTVYEHGLLYNRHPNDESLNVGGQTQIVVDDETVSIVALRGNYSETGDRTASIDSRAFSTSTNTVTVESDEDDPLTVTLPTANPDHWNETLTETIDDDHDVEPTDENVTITFDDGTYEFQLAEVGIGDASRAAPAARVEYIETVHRDGSVQIVEFRDRFNNPVPNARIIEIDDIDALMDETDGISSVSTLLNQADTTGSDGRIRIPRDGAGSEASAGHTYSWVEETDDDGRVEVSFDEIDGEFEEDDIAITATSISEENDLAYTTEIVDLDEESATVQVWQISRDRGWFDFDIADEVSEGVTVHIISNIDSDEGSSTEPESITAASLSNEQGGTVDVTVEVATDDPDTTVEIVSFNPGGEIRDSLSIDVDGGLYTRTIDGNPRDTVEITVIDGSGSVKDTRTIG